MNHSLQFVLIFSLLFTVGNWLLPFNFKIDSVLAQLQVNYKIYTELNTFSIDYPQGWIVERNDRNHVTLWSQKPISGGGTAPTSMMKTDVRLVPDSYEKSVKEYLNPTEATGLILLD